MVGSLTPPVVWEHCPFSKEPSSCLSLLLLLSSPNTQGPLCLHLGQALMTTQQPKLSPLGPGAAPGLSSTPRQIHLVHTSEQWPKLPTGAQTTSQDAGEEHAETPTGPHQYNQVWWKLKLLGTGRLSLYPVTCIVMVIMQMGKLKHISASLEVLILIYVFTHSLLPYYPTTPHTL